MDGFEKNISTTRISKQMPRYRNESDEVKILTHGLFHTEFHHNVGKRERP